MRANRSSPTRGDIIRSSTSPRGWRAVARRHGRTAGQVAIRWLVQQPDVIAIPRSSKPEHARANLDVMDFALSEDDMDRISRLGTRQGRLVNPAWSPRWD